MGRALGRIAKCVHYIVAGAGGGTACARQRAPKALTLADRETISRGVASGSSLRAISRDLRRAPSTVCREVRRHGGAPVSGCRRRPYRVGAKVQLVSHRTQVSVREGGGHRGGALRAVNLLRPVIVSCRQSSLKNVPHKHLARPTSGALCRRRGNANRPRKTEPADVSRTESEAKDLSVAVTVPALSAGPITASLSPAARSPFSLDGLRVCCDGADNACATVDPAVPRGTGQPHARRSRRPSGWRIHVREFKFNLEAFEPCLLHDLNPTASVENGFLVKATRVSDFDAVQAQASVARMSSVGSSRDSRSWQPVC